MVEELDSQLYQEYVTRRFDHLIELDDVRVVKSLDLAANLANRVERLNLVTVENLDGDLDNLYRHCVLHKHTTIHLFRRMCVASTSYTLKSN